MDAVTVCITVIVTMLGIAYPILLQVISTLDEKYNSHIVIELFYKEEVKQRFTNSLIFALLNIFVLLLKLPVLIDHSYIRDINNFLSKNYYGRIWNFEEIRLVENSAMYLLVLATIVVIIYFLKFINCILIYLSPPKLVDYLISKDHESRKFERNVTIKSYLPKIVKSVLESYNASNNYKRVKHFKVIADLFYFSIKNQDAKIAKMILNFMQRSYVDNLYDSEDDGKNFSPEYYEMISKSVEEISAHRNNRLFFLEPKLINYQLIYDQYGKERISDKTYAYIWQNFITFLTYNRQDYILSYCKHAIDISNRWNDVFLINDIAHALENEKKYKIDKHNKAKNKFHDFHFALGVLLCQENKYSSLSNIFYTTIYSFNNENSLWPRNLDQIFCLYSRFTFPDDTYSSNVFEKWLYDPNSNNKVRYNVIYQINLDHVHRFVALLILSLYFFAQDGNPEALELPIPNYPNLA